MLAAWRPRGGAYRRLLVPAATREASAGAVRWVARAALSQAGRRTATFGGVSVSAGRGRRAVPPFVEH
eukprot:15441662-Alexandrium_andersonii.AAC.1